MVVKEQQQGNSPTSMIFNARNICVVYMFGIFLPSRTKKRLVVRAGTCFKTRNSSFNSIKHDDCKSVVMRQRGNGTD